MKPYELNDENKCVATECVTSIKENIVVDAVKNKNTSLLRTKVSYDNVYSKKPIFRRKLIEKYSTARYNLNTKLIYATPKIVKKKLKRCNLRNQCSLKKLSSNNVCNNLRTNLVNTLRDEKNHFSKTDSQNVASRYENINDLKTSNITLSNADDSKFEEGTSARIKIPLIPAVDCEELDETHLEAHNGNSADKFENAYLDNTPDKNSEEISPKSSEIEINNKNCNDARIDDETEHMSHVHLRDNKATSLEKSKVETVITKKWKLVPTDIYNYFSKLYNKNKNICKKRKKKGRKWNENKTKRNACKPKLIYNYCDPYLECLSESNDDNPENINENICMSLYVGVNRPLFPLVYRNITVLNDKKDTEITDFWAEFSLTTLITKPPDLKPKPLLLQVKDTKLMSAILDCKDKVPFQFEEFELQQNKKVKENNLKHKKGVFRSSVEFRKNATDTENKIREVKKDTNTIMQKAHFSNNDNNQIVNKNYTVTRKLSNEFCEEMNFENNDVILEKSGYKPCYVVLPKLDIKEENEAPSSLDSDEIRNNDESGFKKLDTPKNNIITDLISNNMQNGNNLTNKQVSPVPVIDDECEEANFFGNEHCTRTFGTMMDFIRRNRSLVYFYKMKRILKFQKHNNKLFQSCVYSRISYDFLEEQNTFVDILYETSGSYSDVSVSNNRNVLNFPLTCHNNSITNQVNAEEYCKTVFDLKETLPEIKQENVKTYNESLLETANDNVKQMPMYSTCNPLDILKFPELSNYEESMLVDLERTPNKFSIRFVDNNLLKKKKNIKWLILRLNKSLVTVIYRRTAIMPFELLFQIIYRADLTKKVVCYTFDKHVEDQLTFGVYGVPGICNAILLGPYEKLEKYHELSALIRFADDILPAIMLDSTLNENFFLEPNESKVNDVCLSWWRPDISPLNVTRVNASLLNFFFVPDEIGYTSKGNEELKISKLVKTHKCTNYLKYETCRRERNYVFFHNPHLLFKSDLRNKRHINNSLSLGNRRKKKIRINHEQNIRFNYAQNERLTKFNEKYSTSSRLVSNKKTKKIRGSRTKQNSVDRVKNEKMRRDEFAKCRELLRLTVGTSKIFQYSETKSNRSLIEILNEAVNVINTLVADNKLLMAEKQRLKKDQYKLLPKFITQLKKFDPRSTSFKKGNIILSHILGNTKVFESEVSTENSNIYNNVSSTLSHPDFNNEKSSYDFIAENYSDKRIFKKKYDAMEEESFELNGPVNSCSSKLKRRRRRTKRFNKKKIKTSSVNNRIKKSFSVRCKQISEYDFSTSEANSFKINARYSSSNEDLLFSEHSYCSRDNSDCSVNDAAVQESSVPQRLHDDATNVINSPTSSWNLPVDTCSDTQSPKNLLQTNTTKFSEQNIEEPSGEPLASNSNLDSSTNDKFSLILTENNKPITKIVIEKLKNENQNSINLPISDRRKRIVDVIHKILQEIVRRARNKSWDMGREERILIPRLQLLQRMLQGANRNRDFSKTKIIGTSVEISDDEGDSNAKSTSNNIPDNSEKDIQSIGNTSLPDETLNEEILLKNSNVNDRQRFYQGRIYNFLNSLNIAEIPHSTNDTNIDGFIVGERLSENNTVVNSNIQNSSEILNSYSLTTNSTSSTEHGTRKVSYQKNREHDSMSSRIDNKKNFHIINPVHKGKKNENQFAAVNINGKTSVANMILRNVNNENNTNDAITIRENVEVSNIFDSSEFTKEFDKLIPLSNSQQSCLISRQQPTLWFGKVNNIHEGVKYRPNILKIPKKSLPTVNGKKKIVVVSINGKPTSLTIKPASQGNTHFGRMRCPSFVPVSSKTAAEESDSNKCHLNIDSDKIVSSECSDLNSLQILNNADPTSSEHTFCDNAGEKFADESFVGADFLKCDMPLKEDSVSNVEDTPEREGSVAISRLGVKSFASINSCFYDMDRLLNF